MDDITRTVEGAQPVTPNIAVAHAHDRQAFAPNPDYLTPKLQTADPITLDGKPIPERRWMVKDYIPHGTVTMLGGDGGIGKSLLAQQLLTCAATGRDWLGQETMACKCIAIFCEDSADELHRRQADINRHYDIDFGDLERLDWAPRVGEDNALVVFEKWQDKGEPVEFYQQIYNLTVDFGAQLVILDSLHDLFPGNENSRPQARQFINLLAGLARDMDGTVVLTAHPSLSGLSSGSGMSGSTAWNNAVRSRLYLTRPKAENDQHTNDERILSRKKANYSAAGDDITVRWKDGVFVADEPETGIFRTVKNRETEDAFLACLDAATAQGRYVTDARTSPRYGPKVFAKMPKAGGARKKDLEAAMERLFAGNQIRMGVARAPNRHNQASIVRVTGGQSDVR